MSDENGWPTNLWSEPCCMTQQLGVEVGTGGNPFAKVFKFNFRDRNKRPQTPQCGTNACANATGPVSNWCAFFTHGIRSRQGPTKRQINIQP